MASSQEPGLLLRGCELDGRIVDLRTEGERIVAIAPELRAEAGEVVVEAGRGALLPGLHDHHLHLFACDAAMRSVPCGPPEVRGREGLARALAAQAGSDGWIRGIGYHEAVMGDLDRGALDALRADLPVRVQHRSGALWSVNSAGLDALRVGKDDVPPGLERDASGRPTGRLFRLDAWIRARLPGVAPPDLAALGRVLARFGITGVSDAGADNDAAVARRLADERAAGRLPQRLLVMGGLELDAAPGFAVGASKILLDDARLPDPERLAHRIRAARDRGRTVAIHAVTRAELVMALGALDEVGPQAGDRIEHASVAPPELVDWIARLGLVVVTQPIFVHDRGDAYLRDVDARDRRWLYRGAGWRQAGVPLAAGSDGPYGQLDPWLAMQTAVTRSTRDGRTLEAQEALSPEEALALYLGPLAEPGSAPRRIEVGAPADLCLLDRGWKDLRHDLRGDRVRATLAAGRLLWQRGERSG